MVQSIFKVKEVSCLRDPNQTKHQLVVSFIEVCTHRYEDSASIIKLADALPPHAHGNYLTLDLVYTFQLHLMFGTHKFMGNVFTKTGLSNSAPWVYRYNLKNKYFMENIFCKSSFSFFQRKLGFFSFTWGKTLIRVTKDIQ